MPIAITSNEMHCSFDIVQLEMAKATGQFGCAMIANYLLGIHQIRRTDTDELVSIVTAAGAVNRFGLNEDYTGEPNK